MAKLSLIVLPDNAFADDVVPDDNETYGKVVKEIIPFRNRD